DDPRRIPEFISRAFHVATSGRPGPVVLALPEDMLVESLQAAPARSFHAPRSAPALADMLALVSALESAERPLVMLGGGGWNGAASDDIARFAATFDLPVACAFRRQDLMDNRHANYVGEAGLGMNPKLAARIKAADLILSVGARLGETTTNGYSLLDVPCPAQRFLHVHPDPNELGRVYQTELSIVSAMGDFAKAAAALTPGRKTPAWGEWTKAARSDYLEFLKPEPLGGSVNLGEVGKHLNDTLPADSISTNGAGNYTLWVQRHYQYRGVRTQMAPTSGTMGYGVPAAIASKVVYPGKTVVCFAGDGCFLMNGQELATAVQYGLDPVFIVVNNGMYGSIRMHQER